MNTKNIATRLIELRNSKNLTQKELALKVGVAPTSIAMYEVGKRIPRDELKIRLAKVFGKSVQSIFFAK